MKVLRKKARRIARDLGNTDKKELAAACAAVLLLVVLVAAAAAVSVPLMKRPDLPETAEDPLRTGKSATSRPDLEKTAYAAETYFEGSDMPADCYDIPFRKTENYESNRKLLDELREDVPEEYGNTASEFLSGLLDHGWRDVVSDQDGYEEKVMGWYGLNGDRLTDADSLPADAEDREIEKESYTAAEFANRLAVWFGDNKANCTSPFQTHRSLLYQDGLMRYVRGAWTLEVDGDEKACRQLQEIIGTPIKPHEPAAFVAEVVFYRSRPDTVAGFTVYREVRGK